MGNTVQIKEGVHWIGIKDPDLKVFDITMVTQWGTTYNSYLVQGEKNVIIDTSKEKFFPEYLENIKELIEPAKIDYIVVNHTEPDHSGALAQLLDIAPQAQIVGSKTAITFLKGITNKEFNQLIVKDGDTIDLGQGKVLKFIMAPYLHWPDSMFTYLEQDQIIFSGDAFGCHYSHEEIFNDLVDDYNLAFDYYYKVIMSPFREKVIEAVNKIRGLEIAMICPAHGPVHRKDPWKYIDLYEKWSKEIEAELNPNYIFIGYVSAYGNTGKMAEALAEGAKEEGFEVEVWDVSTHTLPEVREKLLRSAGFMLGSCTINRDTLIPMWDVLASICPIRNKGKLVAAFGSFGWSGEAVPMMEERFKSLRLSVFEAGVKVTFIPTSENLGQCKDYGRRFAQKLKEARQ